jgi:ABC-type lipoprotein release transport system permease subunit
VTVAAMSLALFVEIHHTSLIDGYMASTERNVLDLEMGDIQVFAPGYRDDPSLYGLVEEPERLVEELDAKGFAASARLLGAGLGAAGDTSAGVMLRGVDVARDSTVSSIGRHVLEGRWLDPADPRGVVVGRKLARSLSVGPGDELVVLTQGADGSMANELYAVRGILKSVGEGVDRAGVYMTESAFRALFVLPSGAHQIVVRRPAGMDLEASKAGVEAIAPGLDVRTWRELMPTIASMLDSMQGVMGTVYVIVFIAVGIVILNAMLMAVFERIREFGVLKALGVGPGGVMKLIVVESTIQTLIAVVAGSLLSIPTLLYLTRYGIDMGKAGGFSIAGIAWDPIWRPVVHASTFTGPIVALVVIVELAILYPALKAALIRPVEAIQHQ